jgi:hypothetical protein
VTDDHYHDDPIEEIPKRKLRTNLLTPAALILGSVLFFQSTLAGNISLSSGTGIEFGQGVSQAVACSGSNNLTLTPYSNFVNASGGGGTHRFSSFTVSNIPTSCYGVDFTINAYGNSSNSALSLFNSTSKNVVVYNNSGTFIMGIGGSGASVASGPGAFTVTFTTPVAASTSVFKLTIQSGTHSPICIDGVGCTVGDIGPGGGRVFYYLASGFTCGPTRSNTCRYLEVSPPALGLASFDNDAVNTSARTWAQSPYQSAAVPNFGESTTAKDVGWGYFNTLAIIAQGNTNPATSAAALAQSFSGGGKTDWHLPSFDEMQILCNWVISGSCFGNAAALNVGVGATGFVAAEYWTSNEWTASTAVYTRYSQGGFQGSTATKSGARLVRPIRAF